MIAISAREAHAGFQANPSLSLCAGRDAVSITSSVIARVVSPTSAATAAPRAPSASISTTPSPAARTRPTALAVASAVRWLDRNQSREPHLRKEGGDQCEDLDPQNGRRRLVLDAAEQTENRSSDREDEDGQIAACQESHLRHALRHVLQSLGLVGSRGQHGERHRGGDCPEPVQELDDAE